MGVKKEWRFMANESVTRIAHEAHRSFECCRHQSGALLVMSHLTSYQGHWPSARSRTIPDWRCVIEATVLSQLFKSRVTEVSRMDYIHVPYDGVSIHAVCVRCRMTEVVGTFPTEVR